MEVEHLDHRTEVLHSLEVASRILGVEVDNLGRALVDLEVGRGRRRWQAGLDVGILGVLHAEVAWRLVDEGAGRRYGPERRLAPGMTQA